MATCKFCDSEYPGKPQETCPRCGWSDERELAEAEALTATELVAQAVDSAAGGSMVIRDNAVEWSDVHYEFVGQVDLRVPFMVAKGVDSLAETFAHVFVGLLAEKDLVTAAARSRALVEAAIKYFSAENAVR